MKKELNVNDPRSVARWASRQVIEQDQNLAIWFRQTLDGTGFMLTGPPFHPPKSGTWTYVTTLCYEDAERINNRGPRGWPALCRLCEKLEEAVPAYKNDYRDDAY